MEGGAWARDRAAVVAAGVLTLAAAAGYSGVGVYRHSRFASNAFDLGDQEQTVWGYGQLRFVHNTVLGIPNLLGDHFHPILMVLAPFCHFWNTAIVLLVAQGVLLALAGVPIFLWGAERLGALAGLAFQASYLTFWGVLAGVIYDFHHIVFAVPAVSAGLYATLNRRNLLLWVAVLVCFLTREDLNLTLIGLGLYIALVQRRPRLGVVLIALSGTWFFLLLRYVMPALAGGPYRHWTYHALGSGPIAALVHVLTHPVDSVRLLFTPVEKVRVWAGTLANWLLLPLASPLFVVALPSLLERFWSSEATLWSFHFHYSMLGAPILTFAALDTVVRLSRRVGGRWPGSGRLIGGALAVATLAVSCVLSALVVRPLAEVTTYVSAARAAQIQSCLDVIPPDASVSASNFLLPHLAERSTIYLLTTRTDADYLAIDVSTYQHFFNGEESQLRATVRRALAGGYGVACTKGLTVILARGATDKSLSPELERWLRGACSGRACEAQGAAEESGRIGRATASMAAPGASRPEPAVS
jgi:uncharacterized membrane protein